MGMLKRMVAALAVWGALAFPAAAQVNPCTASDDATLFASVAGTYEMRFYPGGQILGDRASAGVPEQQHYGVYQVTLRVEGSGLLAVHPTRQRSWAPGWGFQIPLARARSAGGFMSGHLGADPVWQTMQTVLGDATLAGIAGCPLTSVPRLTGAVRFAGTGSSVTGQVTRTLDLLYLGASGFYGVLREDFQLAGVGNAMTLEVVRLIPRR